MLPDTLSEWVDSVEVVVSAVITPELPSRVSRVSEVIRFIFLWFSYPFDSDSSFYLGEPLFEMVDREGLLLGGEQGSWLFFIGMILYFLSESG